MKNSIIGFLGFCLCGVAIFAQPVDPTHTFSEFINRQWMLGKKLEVQQVADTRLARDPNDMAALLLSFDYGVGFMDKERLNEILPRLKKQAEKLATPEFLKAKVLLLADIEMTEQVLPKITAAEMARESSKGNIAGKPLTFLKPLQSLESDGLVTSLTAQERALFVGPLTAGSPHSLSSSSQGSGSPNLTQVQQPAGISAESKTSKLKPIAGSVAEASTCSWWPWVVGVLLIGLIVFLFKRVK